MMTRIVFGIMTAITISGVCYLIIDYFKTSKREEEFNKKVKENKINEWLFNNETYCNIERFKRNPELFEQVFNDALTLCDKQYLLDRYTEMRDGKRYFKQVQFKEFRDD